MAQFRPGEEVTPREGARFRHTLLELAMALYHITPPDQQILVQLAFEMLILHDETQLLEDFLNTHPHWDEAYQQDPRFFQHYHLCTSLPMDRIPYPASSIYWEFYHALVRIAVRHVHRTRQPHVEEIENGIICHYTVSYREDMKMYALGKKWGVELGYAA
jgi:hypothetical protein